ncbi:metallophosphoesterase [Methylobacterium haplocladii]|uniref:Phosphatase n=1 Tax=Methylobacterium haplocladii TaxID=1176176 RepID=A0A512IJ30_9HYPH|nr:metallophosphoesterase [Methylobacterium haplocladii]GEO97638.1 phosphatase [Methylobacterium haplocladii]GJD84487.1 3',5'-cyclic adenosine monophosphate phosphodiesterase CpdA [Methylobacterium haplocladii]GLS57368.1 phosphatase [Methylobacterium haplocladii]
MPSRRTVLAGGAAMLAGPFPAASAAGSAPLRFGVVADPQYADAEPHVGLQRYYRNSLGKLRAAIAAFNAEDLDFVVTLGDVIDRHAESYDAILPIYATLRHRHVVLLGNHDYALAPDVLKTQPGLLGLAATHYDYTAGGMRFVVLDGNDVSLFAPPPGDPRWAIAQDRIGVLAAAGAENAKPWNGSLSDAQFAWLGDVLDDARAKRQRVVVLNHYPVFPANPHNMWDSGRIAALLARHPHVVAYFCGHNHAGNYAEAAGLHYVNFHGMVDTPAENAYAIVEIAGDRLDIRGFGREPSRSLRLRSA